MSAAQTLQKKTYPPYQHFLLIILNTGKNLKSNSFRVMRNMNWLIPVKQKM